jgi:hypothetical protein
MLFKGQPIVQLSIQEIPHIMASLQLSQLVVRDIFGSHNVIIEAENSKGRERVVNVRLDVYSLRKEIGLMGTIQLILMVVMVERGRPQR